MKRDSFRVLFFLKKTRLLKNGEASVCMRITVNGTRVENNIRKSIDPALWSQAKETARGKSRRACDLNTYIEEARIKLYQIFCELEQQNRPVTAHLLQELFFGQEKPEEVRTLLGTMQEHNDQCRALVGADYGPPLRELPALSGRVDPPALREGGSAPHGGQRRAGPRLCLLSEDGEGMPAEYRHPLHEVFEKDYQSGLRQ